MSHPIETGDLTGYLTSIGDERYLDVMPAAARIAGRSCPGHAVLRVRLDGDRLELTPLSYDWIYDRLRAGTRPPGLSVVLDQKENALILSSTSAFRTWLRVSRRTARCSAPRRIPSGAGRDASGLEKGVGE